MDFAGEPFKMYLQSRSRALGRLVGIPSLPFPRPQFSEHVD